jgi:hypothetical protein
MVNTGLSEILSRPTLQVATVTADPNDKYHVALQVRPEALKGDPRVDESHPVPQVEERFVKSPEENPQRHTPRRL